MFARIRKSSSAAVRAARVIIRLYCYAAIAWVTWYLALTTGEFFGYVFI